jgi:hypothetical protein
MALWLTVGTLAPAIPSKAQDELPPTDLRYTGIAAEVQGCFEARDTEFVNPLNLEHNILGFNGTPENPRPTLKYVVELPEGVEEGVNIQAFLQIRFVQHEGWEPAEAAATVKYEDRGAPLADPSYIPEGTRRDVWTFTFPSKGPGVYTVAVRVGGARYFHGQVSRTLVALPESDEPATRSEWFAAHGMDETEALAFEATRVSAPAAEEVRDEAFPQAALGDQTINAVRWAYNDFSPRLNAIYYPITVGPEDVDRELELGIFLRYPVGEGRLQVRDATDEGVIYLDMPVYPSPEPKVVWAPVRFDKAGVYSVLFIDEGVGRAEATVYRLCYLKAAG